MCKADRHAMMIVDLLAVMFTTTIPEHSVIRFSLFGIAVLLFVACVAAAHLPTHHRDRGGFR